MTTDTKAKETTACRLEPCWLQVVDCHQDYAKHLHAICLQFGKVSPSRPPMCAALSGRHSAQNWKLANIIYLALHRHDEDRGRAIADYKLVQVLRIGDDDVDGGISSS